MTKCPSEIPFKRTFQGNHTDCSKKWRDRQTASKPGHGQAGLQCMVCRSPGGGFVLNTAVFQSIMGLLLSLCKASLKFMGRPSITEHIHLPTQLFRLFFSL